MAKNKKSNESNLLEIAQKSFLALAPQIADPEIKNKLLILIKNLSDPNARAELDALETTLKTKCEHHHVAAIFSACVMKADRAAQSASQSRNFSPK